MSALNIGTTALAEGKNTTRIVKIFGEDGPRMSSEVVDMIKKNEVMGSGVLLDFLEQSEKDHPSTVPIITARIVELYSDQADNHIFCTRIRILYHKKVEAKSRRVGTSLPCCLKTTTRGGALSTTIQLSYFQNIREPGTLVRLQIGTAPTRRVPALILISDEP
jgi:hypothetical protein